MIEAMTAYWPFTLLGGLSTFLLGRFWESSSRIFSMRQQAYSSFLENCASVYEFLMLDTDEDHWKLLSNLRKGTSNLGLYASPAVDQLAGEYLGMVAKVVAVDKSDTPEFMRHINTLENHYAKLNDAMRKDALGWTFFGFLDRFTRKKQSHTAWENRK